MSNAFLSRASAAASLAFLLCACGGGGNSSGGGSPVVPVPVQYTLGGGVIGSTGSLTLINEIGSQTVVVAAAGNFTFATGYLSGAEYRVTVQTQPSGQTCVVTNGTGQITASVSNVTVTCTTNGLTLGGTVSGLGAGKSVALLALAAGANSARTVTASGTFTFPANFMPNTEYEVLVQTQPAGQTCTVQNPTGDIGGSAITNISVTCIDSSASNRNWQTAANVAPDLDPLDPNDLRTPRVAFDAAGNALAVWSEDRIGPEVDIMWSRKPAGGQWTTPAMVPQWVPTSGIPGADDDRRDPELAVAANGNAIVIWRMSSYRGAHVLASTYTPAGGWSQAEFLWYKHPDLPSGAVDLRIAIDANGNGLATWSAADIVYYNRYTPGTGWVYPAPFDSTNQQPVSSIAVGPADNSDMAMNSSGQAVLLWRQGRNLLFNPPFDFDLFASRYDMATDTWSTPVQVEDGERDQFYGTSVVIDSAGTATAVWSDYDGDRTHIRASRAVANVWTPPTIVESGNTGPTGFDFDPHAVVDGANNVTVVWQQGDIDQANFMATRYVPGTVWGGQQVIGSYVGSSSPIFTTELRVAGNAAGHVVAVWTRSGCVLAENVACPWDVRANEYNPANGNWGAEEVIDKEETPVLEYPGEAQTPFVAVDAAGNAIAIWDQDEGQLNNGIRAAVFE